MLVFRCKINLWTLLRYKDHLKTKGDPCGKHFTITLYFREIHTYTYRTATISNILKTNICTRTKEHEKRTVDNKESVRLKNNTRGDVVESLVVKYSQLFSQSLSHYCTRSQGSNYLNQSDTCTSLQVLRGKCCTFDEAEIPTNEDGRWSTNLSFGGSLFKSLSPATPLLHSVIFELFKKTPPKKQPTAFFCIYHICLFQNQKISN